MLVQFGIAMTKNRIFLQPLYRKLFYFCKILPHNHLFTEQPALLDRMFIQNLKKIRF